MLALIWTAVLLAVIVAYFHRIYTRFSRHGVKHFRPIPLIGTMGRVMAQMDHFADDIDRTYHTFSSERFVGRFDFVKPTLVIRDVELVKKITVKDFEHFLDHQVLVDEKTDPFFGRSLFLLRGQEWKDMRSTLSPAFTSSKMRTMIPFMVEVSDQMMRVLKRNMKDAGADYIDVEARDLASRFTNDVIASCAFGLKVDSHAEQNNKFYEMGKAISHFKFVHVVKMLFLNSVPFLMSKLDVTLFPKSATSFFKNIVLTTMRDREAKNTIRQDMIHLLMEANKGKLTHDDKSEQDADAGFATVEESAVGKKQINRVWSDNDLVAQAVLFFLAGFETVSTAMSFALHELALNPDVQEKLAQEVKEYKIKNGDNFDYKAIQDMVYMDMVVTEVLRRWPPAIFMERQCIKDYNLGKPNAKATKDYMIRKGEGLIIPTWAFHHDPKYYPNPMKFDPERFSEENKHNIKPFTYMPFGLGPRNCIGSRFALCEVKVMLYHFLQQWEISTCDKTSINAVLSSEINPRIKGGHWIRLRARN